MPALWGSLSPAPVASWRRRAHPRRGALSAPAQMDSSRVEGACCVVGLKMCMASFGGMRTQTISVTLSTSANRDLSELHTPQTVQNALRGASDRGVPHIYDSRGRRCARPRRTPALGTPTVGLTSMSWRMRRSRQRSMCRPGPPAAHNRRGIAPRSPSIAAILHAPTIRRICSGAIVAYRGKPSIGYLMSVDRVRLCASHDHSVCADACVWVKVSVFS